MLEMIRKKVFQPILLGARTGVPCMPMRGIVLILVVLGLQSCFLFRNDEKEAHKAMIAARGDQAETALTTGDYVEAARLFEEILSVEPENVPAWIGMGDAYGEMGEWDHAEPAFAEASRLKPESYDAQFGHGLALQMLNRVIEAVAAYHRALTIDPMSGNASLGVATSYLQLEEPQHALPFAERAVELDPDDGRAWISLGAAAEQVGDHEKALDAYLAASERLEASPELKHNLLHAYARAKRYQEVVGIARSMLADQANADAAERMGWAYFRLGNYEKSANAYRRAVEIDPPMWRAWNGLGVTALNRWLLSEQADEKSRLEASAAFTTSLRLQPDQPKVAQLIERYRL
ncbi:MAG: tetratricopeptide repeat protein [Planctomycetes bacterium]|nr:tetratricopeptide repeat protein [Planctomycetota bacterium]